MGVEAEDLPKLDGLVKRSDLLHRNDVIYRQGDEFHSLYAVRLGCIKTVRTSRQGDDQVTGFYLPGEIFGMDGIGAEHHTNTAIALETAAVCELPFAKLEELSAKIPSLQHYVFQLLSREIGRDQRLIGLLSRNSAEERIAALLVRLSMRFAERKQSATRFRLPMSRSDMGSWLGLTVETVSRVLGRMQKDGILKVDNKEITILDMDRLRAQVEI